MKIFCPSTGHYLKGLAPLTWTASKDAAAVLSDEQIESFISQGGALVNSCQVVSA